MAASASALGELLFALTGMIFGTWISPGPRSATSCPPPSSYDVLLSPFVLYAVIRARALAAPSLASQGLAGFPGGSASQPLGVPGLAGAVALFSGSGAVVRDSGTGRCPEAEGPDPAGRVRPRVARPAGRGPPRPGRRGRCT